MTTLDRAPDSQGEPAFTVPVDLEGWRLDRALARLVPGRSRESLRASVEGGAVRVDGAVVRKPAHALSAGQRLQIAPGENAPARSGNRSGGEFRVIFSDAHLLVVDKPAGMVAHPGSAVGGGTVSELAQERFGPLPAVQGADRPGIVHRLDAETSGVMILARSEEAAAGLLEQFHARRVVKTYLALVQGEPRFDSDWIEAPLMREGGRVQVAPAGQGRVSATFYTTLERLGPASWLEVRPRTGRTHQIRVHLESIGHPLIGDRLYRGRKGAALPAGAPPLARQALHAAKLELVHPVGGAPLCFEAPLPADLAALLDWLRAAHGPAARPPSVIP